MPSAQEAGSQPRRPGLGRHASSTSQISQSPSEHSTSYRTGGYKAQKHVVGKLGRNVSFGKNLHKLNATASANAPDADGVEARKHKRSSSGGQSASSSPARPGVMKRNTSSTAVKRNLSHTALRKNLSSGHLPRHGASKNTSKSSKAEAPSTKRTLSHPHNRTKEQSPSPPTLNPTVRFDVGEDEGQDDAWTEDSASQSPETTRSNTRNNSMILNQSHDTDGTQEARTSHTRTHSDQQVHFAPPSTSPPQSAQHHSLSPSPKSVRDGMADANRINGSSSFQPAVRPPDADIITARLLQRAPHNAAAPKTSTISATASGDTHSVPSLIYSQASTLNETPGRDLVSRFINGSGSSGNTPREGSLLHLPSRARRQEESDEESDKYHTPRRNKSASNMAHPLSAASSASHGRAASQSHASTPAVVNPELHPSRTQQKLWLQRASSVIEPQKMVPAVIPRSGLNPSLLASGNYSAAVDGVGRLDPRLQRQFDQVQLEYKAIRRYRNPLAEAVKRLEQVEGDRKTWVTSGASTYAPSSAATVNGHRDGTRTPVPSSRASTAASARTSGAATPARTHAENHERLDVSSRRSRVSFDVPRHHDEADEQDGEDEDGDDDEGSLRSAGETTIASHRDDALEICRRLWDDMPGSGSMG